LVRHQIIVFITTSIITSPVLERKKNNKISPSRYLIFLDQVKSSDQLWITPLHHPFFLACGHCHGNLLENVPRGRRGKGEKEGARNRLRWGKFLITNPTAPPHAMQLV
jgi:hypothetical protein